jgi:hypothetical protein
MAGVSGPEAVITIAWFPFFKLLIAYAGWERPRLRMKKRILTFRRWRNFLFISFALI